MLVKNPKNWEYPGTSFLEENQMQIPADAPGYSQNVADRGKYYITLASAEAS